MNILKIFVGVVVAALLVAAGVHFLGRSDALGSGGNVSQQIDTYVNGIAVGAGPSTRADVRIAARVLIPPGTNQVAWRNTTGRSVYVDANSVGLGFSTGTASSSLTFYVGTSTSATFSDYSRPSQVVLSIDGAKIATSSTRVWAVGTTTSAGTGFLIPDRGYLIWDVQSTNGPACSGAACETATSTNRGITNFIGYFTAHYAVTE